MVELGHFREVDNILERIFRQGVETFDDVLEKGIEKMREEPPVEFSLKDSKFKFDINTIKLDQLIELPPDAFPIFN